MKYRNLQYCEINAQSTEKKRNLLWGDLQSFAGFGGFSARRFTVSACTDTGKSTV